MKNIKIVALAVALLLASVMPGLAQTTTTQTTLTAAVTSTAQRFITVASTTGFSASGGTGQYFVYIDRSLHMVQSVNTTTGVVGIGPAVAPTVATRHNLNSLVFFGQGGSRWDPSTGNVSGPGPFITVTPYGPCQETTQNFKPVVNTANGDVIVCDDVNSTTAAGAIGLSGRWRATNLTSYAASVPVINIADAAYSALLSDYVINYVSLTAGRTVTLPACTGCEGKVYVVRDSVGGSLVPQIITVAGSAGQGVGTTGAGNTVAIAAVQGASLSFVMAPAVSATGAATNLWVWLTLP